MRPGIQLIMSGICMLAGITMQFIPGIESWTEWQIAACALLLVGGILFYYGCKHAARRADKAAYSASRAFIKNASNSDRHD